MTTQLVLPGGFLAWVYEQLLQAYGQQRWWPAESPFEVMVGAILTQNTSWTNVEKAIANLKREAMLAPDRLADADPSILAQIIRPAGYFNIKTQRLQAFCRFYQAKGEKVLADLPTSELRQALLAVHGVGPETADDMLLYAFNRPVFVVDAYSRRLFSRLGLCAENEPYERLRLALETCLDAGVELYNAYHALIVCHAKQHCRKNPRCSGCPVQTRCTMFRP